MSTIATVTSSVNALFSQSTRGTVASSTLNLDEESCKAALSPLTASGVSIRNEVLAVANDKTYDISEEELNAIKEMDEATLAELAYFVGVIQTCNDDDLIMDLMNNEKLCPITLEKQRPLTKDDYLDCFLKAAGWEVILGLADYAQGTAACMTVADAVAACKVLAKRTLGWVGVAYVVYQFTDCLGNKRNS